ncbi:MAG TPA: hypothetical protein VN774_07905, partial [Candidatus Limnocylindrales bacterium]|nr:hypothetical protein [Candidatus Limnocylindrales bacterium]
MQLHILEQRSLERQVTLARPVLIVLALISLLLLAPKSALAAWFLAAYLILGLGIALAQGFPWGRTWRFPLIADLIALVAFLVITPSVVPLWFLLLIAAYAVGVSWGGARAYWIVAALAIATFGWGMIRSDWAWTDVLRGMEVACGTLISGLSMAYLGNRNRQQESEMHFLSDLTAMLRVEQGVAESLRGMLGELVETFDCERAFLVHRDTELERIFLWRIFRGASGHLA